MLRTLASASKLICQLCSMSKIIAFSKLGKPHSIRSFNALQKNIVLLKLKIQIA